MRKIAIIGSGGYAHVIKDLIESLGGYQVKGFIGKGKNEGTEYHEADLARLRQDEISDLVNGVGQLSSPRLEGMMAKYRREGFRFPKLIHPTAVVSKTATVGDGTVILEQAIVKSNARIGQFCLINSQAVVSHDCEISDYVHLSLGAKIGGQCKIGRHTFLGINASVIQGKTIGSHVIIGAGTVVIDDVRNHVTVAGNPGKIIKIRSERAEVVKPAVYV